MRDQTMGICSICNLTLCRCSLIDRIDTDRRAIFGHQFTKPRNEARIEFPQRGWAIRVESEEELTCVQISLMKDYVVTYAEHVLFEWELYTVEPDRFMGTLRPAIYLFKGWHLLSQHSQFFTDRDAFLKLIAWAELVRLMNITRVAMHKMRGPVAAFPQLSGLYRGFGMAKDHCELERKTWVTNRIRTPDCEKIAQDVCNIAYRSHSGAQ
jgi:hypothetical protein